jgi:aspartyl-tRNA(Asn)/glutamyl-tRNA(Gln) amidotransferase subunit C
MKIDREGVLHVARLARLKVTDDDVSRLTDQMNSILTYMEKLETLDTEGIEPMAHALSLATPFREDEIRPSLDQDETLANAPSRQGEFFQVPKVI